MNKADYYDIGTRIASESIHAALAEGQPATRLSLIVNDAVTQYITWLNVLHPEGKKDGRDDIIRNAATDRFHAWEDEQAGGVYQCDCEKCGRELYSTTRRLSQHLCQDCEEELNARSRAIAERNGWTEPAKIDGAALAQRETLIRQSTGSRYP